jgi:hypothetical protein
MGRIWLNTYAPSEDFTTEALTAEESQMKVIEIGAVAIKHPSVALSLQLSN